MENAYELQKSPLCQRLTRDGKTVEVEIYRGPDSDWLLEVVDEFGNSTVWDDQFPTDKAAFQELEATLKEEGIGSLIGPPT